MLHSYLSKKKKEKKDEDTFSSKLYFNLENFAFPSQTLPDPNVSINTTLNSKNETLPIRQYLSKDLLDTINSSILENEINENDILFSSLHNYNNNNQNIKEEEEEEKEEEEKEEEEEEEEEEIFKFNKSVNKLKDKNSNYNKIKNVNNINEENYDIIIPIKKKKKNKKNFEVREGDWTCYFCKNLNFSFRKKCNRCGVNKDYSESQHDKCMEHVLSIINDNERKRKKSSSQ